MDEDPRPKAVACPECKHRIAVIKGGQLRRHGKCRGWIAVIGYRYEIVDSDVEKLPIGSLLIYREYRGSESQQDMLIKGEHAGGWYMEFVDIGVKYDNRWYDLEGHTESTTIDN